MAFERYLSKEGQTTVNGKDDGEIRENQKLPTSQGAKAGSK